MPVDPDYPQERIDYMVQDSDCRAVIDKEELARFAEVCAQYSGTNPPGVNQPTDLAYVIYMSGTKTGRPKGALVEHRGWSIGFNGCGTCYGFGPGDVWTAENHSCSLSMFSGVGAFAALSGALRWCCYRPTDIAIPQRYSRSD